jgi:ribosomal protein S18 acetylase RimI-like enzyme
MNPMLREATHDDLPILVDLMQDFYNESEFELDRVEAAAAFTSLLNQQNFGAIWLAMDGDEVGGYVVLTVRFAMEFAGLDGAIDDLYVRPASRRKGLGKALLESLLVECHDRGLEALHVEVAPDNVAAQTLYQSLGLQLRTDKRDHLRMLLKSEF